MVTGTPTLRTPEGERVLAPWDIAWFHPRPGAARTGCATTPTSRRASSSSRPSPIRSSPSTRMGQDRHDRRQHEPGRRDDPRLGGAEVNLRERRPCRLPRRRRRASCSPRCRRASELGRRADRRALYEFEPGNQLWPYHFHAGNEEWAIVVSGDADCCALRKASESCAPATSSGSRRARRARTRSTTAAPEPSADRHLLDAQERVLHVSRQRQGDRRPAACSGAPTPWATGTARSRAPSGTRSRRSAPCRPRACAPRACPRT